MIDRYAIGFAFCNCIWALATLGTELSIYSIFALAISLIGVIIESKQVKE